VAETYLKIYKKRYGGCRQPRSGDESGCARYARQRVPQAGICVGHISAMLDVLKTFEFEERRGTTRLMLEPVGGLCPDYAAESGAINQVAAKVIPALAAAATMVLKAIGVLAVQRHASGPR